MIFIPAGWTRVFSQTKGGAHRYTRRRSFPLLRTRHPSTKKKTTSEKQKTLICGIYEKSKERDVNFGDIKHLSMHLIPMCHKSVRQRSSRQKSTVKIIEKENKRFGKQEARIGNNNKILWKEFVSTRERGFPCFTRLNRGKREKKNEGIKGKPVRTDYNEVLRWIFLFFFFFFSHLFYPSSDPVAAGSISWQPKTKPKREVTSIVLIKVTDGEKKNQRGHQRKKRSTLMTCCSCVSKLGSFTFQGSGGIGWVLDPETRFFFLLNLPQPQNTKF